MPTPPRAARSSRLRATCERRPPAGRSLPRAGEQIPPTVSSARGIEIARRPHRIERVFYSLRVPGLDPALLEAVRRPQISLLWGTQLPTRSLLAMFTVLAVQGHRPRLFDGGNRFDGYFVARLARQITPRPHAVLDAMRLSRAFTCFQLAELIGTASETASPLLVLDLLNTFYDESVPLRESERLLGRVIDHLRRLARSCPVIVGARQPQSLVKERWSLLERLQAAADASWMLRLPPGETADQPRLF